MASRAALRAAARILTYHTLPCTSGLPSKSRWKNTIFCVVYMGISVTTTPRKGKQPPRHSQNCACSQARTSIMGADLTKNGDVFQYKIFRGLASWLSANSRNCSSKVRSLVFSTHIRQLILPITPALDQSDVTGLQRPALTCTCAYVCLQRPALACTCAHKYLQRPALTCTSAHMCIEGNTLATEQHPHALTCLSDLRLSLSSSFSLTTA